MSDIDRAAHLDDGSAQDTGLAVGIAALQLVPVAGPIIATFISEFVPRQKQRRLVQFVGDLGREFEAERARIDQDYVRTDEFQGLVEEVLEHVQEHKNEEKLSYWAALLVGISRTDRPAKAEQERMIETLNGLRASHLRLLHVISTTAEARPGFYAGGMNDTLQWKIPGVPFEEIRADWDDLARFKLVQEYVSGIMTSEGAGNLTVRLTPLGQRFVAMLNLRSRSQSGST